MRTADGSITNSRNSVEVAGARAARIDRGGARAARDRLRAHAERGAAPVHMVCRSISPGATSASAAATVALARAGSIPGATSATLPPANGERSGRPAPAPDRSPARRRSRDRTCSLPPPTFVFCFTCPVRHLIQTTIRGQRGLVTARSAPRHWRGHDLHIARADCTPSSSRPKRVSTGVAISLLALRPSPNNGRSRRSPR